MQQYFFRCAVRADVQAGHKHSHGSSIGPDMIFVLKLRGGRVRGTWSPAGTPE